MWVPPEDKDPVVFHAPTRQSVACFGAVSLLSGKFVHVFSPVFNAVTFEVFLKALLRRRSRHKKMVVVLDNASYHRAKLLQPLAAGSETHAAQFSRWGLGRRSIPAKQPVAKPTRRSAGDPSRPNSR